MPEGTGLAPGQQLHLLLTEALLLRVGFHQWAPVFPMGTTLVRVVLPLVRMKLKSQMKLKADSCYLSLSLGNSKLLKLKDQMLEGTYRCLPTLSPGCPCSNSTQRPPGTSPARSWTFGKPPGAWKEKQPSVKSPGRCVDNNKASSVFPSRICTARMSAQHKAITKPFGLLVATRLWHDPNRCFSRLCELSTKADKNLTNIFHFESMAQQIKEKGFLTYYKQDWLLLLEIKETPVSSLIF